MNNFDNERAWEDLKKALLRQQKEIEKVAKPKEEKPQYEKGVKIPEGASSTQPIKKSKKEVIDELLDYYNSCMTLYRQLKDEKYKKEAEKTLEDLKDAQNLLKD